MSRTIPATHVTALLRAATFGQRMAWWVMSGFGAGRSPVAPGTVGTLIAVPLYLLVRDVSPFAYAALVAILFALGVWLCGVAERGLGVHDHASIVWDEITGFLITMFLAPRGWVWLAIGFALFRLFDIWKPYPIGAVERAVRGGLGSMLDDVLAGVFAFALLQLAARMVSAL